MDFKKILFKTNVIDVEKSLPDAVLYIDKEGKIEWANDVSADFFATSKMHLLTSDISDLIETGLNIVKISVDTGKSVITKVADDKEIYYDMTAREVEEGYVLAFRKISENSVQNEEKDYTEVNREKNNFIVKIANDLKSPIQSIVGFSQAMSDGLGGEMSEQQEKYIKIINKNSTDLMYLVGKIIELSQTESCPNKVDKKPLDVSALINSVVKFNGQLFKGKDININITLEDGFKKTINSDRDILKNILQDVLEVIMKSVDMGEVGISLSNPNEEFCNKKKIRFDNYTMIKISSSALLLAENDLDCIFDPYKIVDSSNRKNVIRAIVLASVKNMVQNLGGMIWVESQILKSTSFNILIPN